MLALARVSSLCESHFLHLVCENSKSKSQVIRDSKACLQLRVVGVKKLVPNLASNPKKWWGKTISKTDCIALSKQDLKERDYRSCSWLLPNMLCETSDPPDLGKKQVGVVNNPCLFWRDLLVVHGGSHVKRTIPTKSRETNRGGVDQCSSRNCPEDAALEPWGMLDTGTVCL